MATKKAHTSATKALQNELIDLNTSPVEGFKVNPSALENMFVWDVAIFGPPMTLYEGGYFKARLYFPTDYPYNPPSVQFLTKMFHPNIYENGEVCISILHSPGDDPQSGELASERWNPTQTVRTILLSVISLLNEPNIHSAAHVEASVSYRKWIESGGKDDEYERIVRSLVQQTSADAEKDGVCVPRTLEEYCVSGRPGNDVSSSDVDKHGSDFDDDYEYYDSDMDEDDNVLGVSADGNACGSMDIGVDSAMEEAENEPSVKSKHNTHSSLSESAPIHDIPCNRTGRSAASETPAAFPDPKWDS
ncbi:unnamed protein product [Dicrocoelium dendriticum]|nr:unnamed protein product [Dicrocoelium dendriticum]